MKKLLSIALVLILSITFVSASQGVSLETDNEINHFETSASQSNLNIATAGIVELEVSTTFLNIDHYLYRNKETLTGITDKYKSCNFINVIYYLDNFSLNHKTINKRFYLHIDKRNLLSLNKSYSRCLHIGETIIKPSKNRLLLKHPKGLLNKVFITSLA